MEIWRTPLQPVPKLLPPQGAARHASGPLWWWGSQSGVPLALVRGSRGVVLLHLWWQRERTLVVLR